MRYLLFILALTVIWSCKSSKPITTTTTSTIIVERQIDTILFTKPDSSSIIALIRCDSLGNAYLSEIKELKIGRSTTPEVRVKDNYIYLKCRVDSMAVFQSYFKRFESSKDTNSTVITVYKDKPKSAFQKLANGLLLFFIGASLVAGLYLFYRKRWA